MQLVFPIVCTTVSHNVLRLRWRRGNRGQDWCWQARSRDLPDDAYDDRGAGVSVRSLSGSIICDSRKLRKPAPIDRQQNRVRSRPPQAESWAIESSEIRIGSKISLFVVRARESAESML